MKKVLIILLSVLLALTFISCEKDKSGEVIQNYEDFMKSYNAHRKASFCNNLVYKYIEYDESYNNGKVEKKFGDDDKADILSFLNDYKDNVKTILNVNADSITIDSVESISGELKGEDRYDVENKEGNFELTASDIVVKFKYTTTTTRVYNSATKQYESKTSDPVDGLLKVNMKYSYKQTEEKYEYSISSFSLQGVSYKDIAYSRARDKIGENRYRAGEFTSATVGGTGVELRLLNV